MSAILEFHFMATQVNKEANCFCFIVCAPIKATQQTQESVESDYNLFLEQTTSKRRPTLTKSRTPGQPWWRCSIMCKCMENCVMALYCVQDHRTSTYNGKWCDCPCDQWCVGLDTFQMAHSATICLMWTRRTSIFQTWKIHSERPERGLWRVGRLLRELNVATQRNLEHVGKGNVNDWPEGTKTCREDKWDVDGKRLGMRSRPVVNSDQSPKRRWTNTQPHADKQQQISINSCYGQTRKWMTKHQKGRES